VTGACARLAAIWDVPHHTTQAHAGALEDLKAEIGGLRTDELTPVISWAYDHVVRGRFQFWIVFALSHIERDARELACPDCASEVRGFAGTRWRYRVIHSASCPWWRAYRAGSVSGHVAPDRNRVVPSAWLIPHRAVVTHRGPYKRRTAQDRSPSGDR
jgi:hypothetical protein